MLFPNWEENEIGISKEGFVSFTDKLTEIQEKDKLFFFTEQYLPMLKALPKLQKLKKTTSIYFEEKFRESVIVFIEYGFENFFDIIQDNLKTTVFDMSKMIRRAYPSSIVGELISEKPISKPDNIFYYANHNFGGNSDVWRNPYHF